MKLSDFVIDFLSLKGIKHSFVVSGGAIIHLIDSCRKHPNLNYICAQHEQNGAAAADMYARVTRNFGLVMTTSGPGATNILTSVCNAFFDSIPLICITGQVASFRIKKNDSLRQLGFQETNLEYIFKSVTKYVKLIKDPLKIKYELEKALYLAKEGRAGPVLLDIPDDLQRVEINPEQLISFSPIEKKLPSLKNEITTLEKMILSSSKPLIIMGAGIHYSHTENKAIEFAKKFQIPILTTWAAKDILPANDPLNAGVFGICGPRSGNFAVQNADLLIILGSRLCQMNTGGKQHLFSTFSKKIMIDIDFEEINKFKKDTFEIDLPIVTELNIFFSEYEKYSSQVPNNLFLNWIKKIKSWEKKYPITPEKFESIKYKVNPYIFLKYLSNFSQENDIIISDTGANLSWTCQAFECKKNQRIFSAWNHTPMGFSLPASVGAAFASDSRIICIIGDGGLMMCLQELASLKRHNLPIYVFLFNNQGHGIQKQTMDNWLNSNYAAVNVKTGLYFPNYEKLAQAFDIDYFEIIENDNINAVLQKIFRTKGPIFCNVHINKEQKILPMLKYGKGLEDLEPQLPEEELKEIFTSCNN
jgi:acetolactate synthase-1/2/3 large subunit